MDQCTILILESFNDLTTCQRHQLLNQSPRLEGFKIEYCYASEVCNYQKENSAESSSLRLTSNDLINYLRNVIEKTKPEVILVHTGVYYISNQDVYHEAFAKLKNEYPKIGTAFQEREDIVLDDSLFNVNDQAKLVRALVFERILNMRL